MKWRAGGTALLGALVLSACASIPRAPGPLAGDNLSGRLAVRVEAGADTPARAESAAFDLQGTPGAGRLKLSTPLGSALAEARWSPGSVALVTPKGERRFPDLDSLTREVLGESIPVAALFDWLRGRPWPGAPSTPDAASGASGFSQLGWQVDVAQQGDGLIVARRDSPPAVTVRAKLDR